MAKEKFNSQEFLSSLFHYAHGFNFNHIIFDANRYRVSVSLMRRSATYGNAEMFYVSADPKEFAPVMSAINSAIEIAELDGYTTKEVAQLQEKTALSTALAAEILSPSCTWGQVGRVTY